MDAWNLDSVGLLRTEEGEVQGLLALHQPDEFEWCRSLTSVGRIHIRSCEYEPAASMKQQYKSDRHIRGTNEFSVVLHI